MVSENSPSCDGWPWGGQTSSTRAYTADAMSVLLSTNLDDPTSIPYFTWDDPMTVAEIRSRLREPASPERTRLLAKIMREARDTEVWKFTTPNEVSAQYPQLRMYLGRRRAFWDYLLGAWRKFGWVDG